MLNDHLYNQLTRKFGEVRLVNEGLPLIARNVSTLGENRREIIQAGEDYAICCPICGDDRFRCHVNHTWGNDDETGVPSSRLVHCFNEKCEAKDGADNLLEYLRRAVSPRISDILFGNKIQSEDLGRVFTSGPTGMRKEPLPWPKPEWCTPVDQVYRTHPAAKYLDSRGFDRAMLARFWGVVFCHTYPVSRMEGATCKDYSWLANRLFFPIGGNGWQARRIDDGKIMKYVTQGEKSKILYATQYAKQYPYTLICEGVTDTWRVGGPSVCTFGKDPSKWQIDAIRIGWGTVGLLLDPDAFVRGPTERESSAEKLYNALRPHVDKLFAINLADYYDADAIAAAGDKLDAGFLTYDQLWACIMASAQTAGISIRRPDGPFIAVGT